MSNESHGFKIILKMSLKYDVVNQNEKVELGCEYEEEKSDCTSTRGIWRQTLISATACFGLVVLGMAMGWMSFSQPKLMSGVDSPLTTNVTLNQISWLGSLKNLGVFSSAFINMYTMNNIGRKGSIVLATPAIFLGWLLATLATSIEMLYAARLFWGLGKGIMLCVILVYISEISAKCNRGLLMTFYHVFFVAGIEIGHIFGRFATYNTLVYTGLTLSMINAVVVYFIPESPLYYMLKGRKTDAEKSFRMLRDKNDKGIDKELEQIEESIMQSQINKRKMLDLFASPGNRRALLISWGMVTFKALCGLSFFHNYMKFILGMSSDSLDAGTATLIVISTHMFSTTMTVIFSHKFDRRNLLLTSAFIMSSVLACMGIYYYIYSNGEKPTNVLVGYIPVASMMIFVMAYDIGPGSQAWAICSEVLPATLKHKVAPISTIIYSLVSFGITKSLKNFVNIGFYYAIWLFSVSNGVMFLFVYILVPKTRNKTLTEIEKMLDQRQKC